MLIPNKHCVAGCVELEHWILCTKTWWIFPLSLHVCSLFVIWLLDDICLVELGLSSAEIMDLEIGFVDNPIIFFFLL
jgi:hypothetical protein